LFVNDLEEVDLILFSHFSHPGHLVEHFICIQSENDWLLVLEEFSFIFVFLRCFDNGCIQRFVLVGDVPDVITYLGIKAILCINESKEELQISCQGIGKIMLALDEDCAHKFCSFKFRVDLIASHRHCFNFCIMAT